MTQETKVSVIVPVYNAEKYLCTCLDSIINQTLKEIEIICVDDGSTDSSWDILQRYREQDCRVTTLRQKNQYAGAARNTGKSHANGEYLVFWDSDDYFYPYALEKMYAQCKKDLADICVCGANQFLEDRGIEVPVSNYMKKKQLPDHIPFNRTTNPDHILTFTTEAPWNKMFRRSYIENLRLNFQPVRNGNDVYFVVNALCLAERITVVDEPLLCYRKNQTDSLVGTLSRSPLTPIQAWIDAAENLKSLHAFPEHSFVNKCLGSIFYLLRNMSEWEAFRSSVLFLQEEGLEKLSIRGKNRDDFYTEWHYHCLEHLLSDSPECFLAYIAHVTYIQQIQAISQKRILSQKNRDQRLRYKEKLSAEKEKNKTLRQKNAALRRQMRDIRASWSFRIGKALVWLPGKIKRLFNH